MDLPPGLGVIHQPQRLRLMAVLYRQRDVSFTVTRDLLGLTDGNLASHARRLEEAGYLASRRALSGNRFEVRYRITEEGARAFRGYLDWLRAFLSEQGGARGPGPAQTQTQTRMGP